MVNTFEQLLGGEELYHYHSKLMMKEVVDMMMMVLLLMMMMIRTVKMMMSLTQAETGGQHVWHQDYGYWWKKIKANSNHGKGRNVGSWGLKC